MHEANTCQLDDLKVSDLCVPHIQTHIILVDSDVCVIVTVIVIGVATFGVVVAFHVCRGLLDARRGCRSTTDTPVIADVLRKEGMSIDTLHVGQRYRGVKLDLGSAGGYRRR